MPKEPTTHNEIMRDFVIRIEQALNGDSGDAEAALLGAIQEYMQDCLAAAGEPPIDLDAVREAVEDDLQG